MAISKSQHKRIGTMLGLSMAEIQKARTWLENLPDNPLYQHGVVQYPPIGQADLAVLVAAYHVQTKDK
jgi:hypothetical protein